MQRPIPTRGMHHVALNVTDLRASEHFYSSLLNLQVEWRPDNRNVYLTSGTDNVALHQCSPGVTPLDHIGFILASPTQVDEWYAYLLKHNVTMKTAPRTHRDGARSFYCLDPEGNTVQLIYHPPLIKS